MLKYQNLYHFLQASARIKSGPNSWSYRNGNNDYNTDKMVTWQENDRAIKDSKSNLDFLLDVGKRNRGDLLVLTSNFIQIVGANDMSMALQDLTPGTWMADFSTWADNSSVYINPRRRSHQSDRGECAEISGGYWSTNNYHGIYEVATGNRIKNRQEIISRFWDHGFAAWRGRPLRVAPVTWAGTRSELEDLTLIASKHWNRKHVSDVAKKLCSAYTATNRYAAWPGSW